MKPYTNDLSIKEPIYNLQTFQNEYCIFMKKYGMCILFRSINWLLFSQSYNFSYNHYDILHKITPWDTKSLELASRHILCITKSSSFRTFFFSIYACKNVFLIVILIKQMKEILSWVKTLRLYSQKNRNKNHTKI